jgi:mRNA-degrading endonuclease RelE of RelBE toxin-antitoxin system
MSYNVIPTDVFLRQSRRLKKKFPSLETDLATLETLLSTNPRIGTSLGNNTFKIRLAIKSKGRGKSGGARIITYVVDRLGNVYTLSIYDKSEMDSLDIAVIRSYTKQIDETIRP